LPLPANLPILVSLLSKFILLVYEKNKKQSKAPGFISQVCQTGFFEFHQSPELKSSGEYPKSGRHASGHWRLN
jgi:hypothetical protein